MDPVPAPRTGGDKVMPMTVPASEQPQRSPFFWGAMFLVMILSGMAIPAQGRVNAELSAAVGDAIWLPSSASSWD